MAEAAFALGEMIEVDARGVLIKPRCDHVLGVFHRDADKVVDLLAGLVVAKAVRTAGEHSVVRGGVELRTGFAERGDRHPKIGNGVLLGAGAKVLGNIKVGDFAKIAAGSVVLQPVPSGCTAAGVPAKLINCPTCSEPARTMDQTLAFDI